MPGGLTERRRRAVALAGAVAIVAVVAIVGVLAAGDGEDASAKPNIVLITTDDQAHDSFNRRVMPNTFELLVDEGTVPEDFIVTTPLCCPSRASLLTGQYGHNNGVLANRYNMLIDKGNTLPVWLREAGYRTAHVGKYLNNYEKASPDVAPAPGWDEWATVVGASYFDYELHLNDGAVEHGNGPRDYLTRVITRHARRAITNADGAEQPLFLQVDYYAPHVDPSDDERCGDAALPDPRDADAFTDPKLPRPASFNEQDVSDKPGFVKAKPPLGREAIAGMKRRYGCALASLQAVDRGVREIVGELEAAGELDDTVIAFMSDNGVLRGQHRSGYGKHLAYEETLRVPVVIRVPPSVVGGAEPPSRLAEPTANIDLAPTFVELAGAEPCTADDECRTMDGRSLVGALTDRGSLPPDRALVVELDEGANPEELVGPCRFRGLRAGGWFYLEHEIAQDLATGECSPVDELELYDLERDRAQLENLLPAPADSAEASRAEELAARLERLAECSGIRGRDPEPDGASYCD
jgi:N-acetylglucosamine-6-sulfatase